MASWKKIIVSGSSPEFNALTVDNNITGGTLTLDSLSAQNSEATSLMINGSGVVGTRELGSNAFNSINIAVTGYNNTGDNRIITSLGGSSINGEANLTFDGSTLSVVGNVSASRYIGSDFGTVTGVSNFTGSFSGDGSGLTGISLKVVDALVNASGTASLDLSNDTLIIAGGNGLTTTVGSKALTLSVVSANNGIVANADNIQLATASSTFTDGVKAKLNADGVISSSIQVDHDATTNFDANEHIDHSTVSITAGNGLTGGGDLTATRTLNVGAGTGIDVAADAISVDVSDFMTNGANNRVLTATGTDAMNAEANLTFDGSLLTVTGNATVTGNLTVQGTTTTLDTQNVLVEDRFIFLNHGSGSVAPTSEGGIVVEGTTPDQGNAFYYDGNSARWSLGESVTQDANSVTPNAFAAAVVDLNSSQTDTATYQKAGNIKVDTQGEIWIYS